MNLFLDTCDLKPTPRRPVWIMRQAGRYLPEYRAVRKNYSFKEMVETPDICTEITLQPIRRFGLDAAIIFSDILVILEALGVPYQIVDGQGPVLEGTVRTRAALDRLAATPVSDSLGYVYTALDLLRRELSPDVALLGFAGAPWTLACYLVEGGSSKNGFPAVKTLLEEEPALFHSIMERLTEAVVDHLRTQLKAGADAVQLFDSWAGHLSEDAFRRASLPYLTRIADELAGERVIFYPRGATQWLTADEAARFHIMGVDQSQPLARYRENWGSDIVLQGNLAPEILASDPGTIARETAAVLKSHGPGPGHIFNLGHGITPEIPIEHVQAVVDAVHSYELEALA